MILGSFRIKWFYYSVSKVGSLVCLALLLTCGLVNEAQAGRVQLCNDGPVKLSYVFSLTSLWLDIAPYNVEAWYGINPGHCSPHWVEDMKLASFAFAVYVEGEMAPVEFSYRSSLRSSKSPSHVCVKPGAAGLEPFKKYGGRSSFQSCGPADNRFPFSIHVKGSAADDSFRISLSLSASERDAIARNTEAARKAADEKAAAEAARKAEAAAEQQRRRKSQKYVMRELAVMCGPAGTAVLGLSLPSLPHLPTSAKVWADRESERARRAVRPDLQDLACDEEKLAFWERRYTPPNQGWRSKNYPRPLACEARDYLAYVGPTKREFSRLRSEFNRDCQPEIDRGDGLWGQLLREINGIPQSRYSECVEYKETLARCDRFVAGTERIFRGVFGVTED